MCLRCIKRINELDLFNSVTPANKCPSFVSTGNYLPAAMSCFRAYLLSKILRYARIAPNLIGLY